MIAQIIKGVRRLIFERLDELDLYDEPEMPPLSIAPMQVVKRGKPKAHEDVDVGDVGRPTIT